MVLARDHGEEGNTHTYYSSEIEESVYEKRGKKSVEIYSGEKDITSFWESNNMNDVSEKQNTVEFSHYENGTPTPLKEKLRAREL